MNGRKRYRGGFYAVLLAFFAVALAAGGGSPASHLTR